MFRNLCASGYFALALLTACVAPGPIEPSYSEQLKLAKTRNAAQADVGRSTGYGVTMATYWMEQQLPEAGNCDAIPGDVVLYLTIEEDGTVSEVLGESVSRRSQCYARAYRDMEVPAPPVSPFYFRLELQ
jgi:hypothetical protein